MNEPIEPKEAAKLMAEELIKNIEAYYSMYEQYQASIALGGHGSCCERITCTRALHEDNLLESMSYRLTPKYNRY